MGKAGRWGGSGDETKLTKGKCREEEETLTVVLQCSGVGLGVFGSLRFGSFHSEKRGWLEVKRDWHQEGKEARE